MDNLNKSIEEFWQELEDLTGIVCNRIGRLHGMLNTQNCNKFTKILVKSQYGGSVLQCECCGHKTYIVDKLSKYANTHNFCEFCGAAIEDFCVLEEGEEL